MNNIPNAGALSTKAKVHYSFGEYVYTYTLMVFMTYFVFFLTDMVGLSAAVAGTIYLVGMIWDGATDPIIGYVSDNVKWKSGRRRTPFMKLAILPVCVFTVLMFTLVDAGEGAQRVYYTLMAILFYTSATTYYICYQALGAEVTNDLDSRASMMSIRSGILSLATAIASAGTYFLLTIFSDMSGSDKFGWIASVGFWCATGFVLALICIKGMKNYERIMPWGKEYKKKDGDDETGEMVVAKEPFIKGIASVFRNKPFIFTLGVMFTCCVGGYGSSSILIYYMTYYVKLSDFETTMAFGLTGVAGVCTMFIASIVMQKLERKTVYIILIGGYTISFIILFFLKPESEFGFYIAMIFWGYGWMCLWSLIYTLIADATVVEEYISGKQKEGTYYGIVQLGLKIGAGIMIWIAGMVFDNAGYVANVDQSASSLEAIRVMNSVVPGMMLVISIVLMCFYPINRKVYNAIIESIAEKREGREGKTIKGLVVGEGKIRIE